MKKGVALLVLCSAVTVASAGWSDFGSKIHREDERLIQARQELVQAQNKLNAAREQERQAKDKLARVAVQEKTQAAAELASAANRVAKAIALFNEKQNKVQELEIELSGTQWRTMD